MNATRHIIGLSTGAAVLAAVVALVGGNAIAEGTFVDKDRKALFISILEQNDCRMHNFYPADGILAAIKEHDFDKLEVRAIGRNLIETGVGEKRGDFLSLKTENCT
ncbi:MAG: hypothetical protein AAF439_09485 [Pseudomonadota bacterium]